jgi:hypothetical protein
MPEVKAGNVQLIDPLDAVTDFEDQYNGTPEYEKMFIFASLRAKRRRRSVIVDGRDRTELEAAEINMLGFDQDKGEFTTNWSENESNQETIFEGFGMTNIRINTNSSYIPEIEIEFLDIRGSAFFNIGAKSPYSLLFDFPPPIFDLTVKGYYGRALTYSIHLTKHETSFESETGNYKIKANFIARTFAPLTDVPFKYAEIFPLIENPTGAVSDPETQKNLANGTTDSEVPDRQNVLNGVAPQNLHELILKTEALYDDIAELQDNSVESQNIDTARTEQGKGQRVIDALNNFRAQFIKNEELQGKSSLLIVDKDTQKENEKSPVQIISRVEQYDSVIKSDQEENAVNENTTKRLFIAIKIGPQLKDDASENENNARQALIDRARKRLTGDPQTKRADENNPTPTPSVATDLVERAQFAGLSVSNADVGGASVDQKIFDTSDNVNQTNQGVDARDAIQYVGLDITDLYQKLRKFVDEQTEQLNNQKGLLAAKAQRAVLSNLGLEPTVYNIFEIICNSVDDFYNILRRATSEAERHHTRFSDQILEEIVDKKTISGFPLVIKTVSSECSKRQERVIPIDLSNKLPEPFPEINLINNFINAFIRIQKEALQRDLREQEDAFGNNKWIPNAPEDSNLISPEKQSPYALIENQYTGVVDQKVDKIYNKILERFYIQSQYSYGRLFYDTSSESAQFFLRREQFANQDFVKFLAGGEAVNLAQSLVDLDTIRIIKQKASSLKASNAGIQEFIRYARDENKFPAYNNLPGTNTPTSNKIAFDNTPPDTITDGERANLPPNNSLEFQDNDAGQIAYKNRKEEGFNGVTILDRPPTPRTETANGDDGLSPVDKYINESSDSGFDAIARAFRASESVPTEFTKENLLIIRDAEQDKYYNTKFVDNYKSFEADLGLLDAPLGIIAGPLPRLISELDFDIVNSYTQVLGVSLARKDKNGVTLGERLITNDSSKQIDGLDDDTLAFLYASAFFRARSPFHNFNDPKFGDLISFQINDLFTFPAVNEVPYFANLYVGGLERFVGDTTFRTNLNRVIRVLVNDFEDFFNDGITKFRAEADRVGQLMAVNDKLQYRVLYDRYKPAGGAAGGEFPRIKRQFENMINAMLDSIEAGDTEASFLDRLENFAEQALDKIAGSSFSSALGDDSESINIADGYILFLGSEFKESVTEFFFRRQSTIVHNQYTFFLPEKDADNDRFILDSAEIDPFRSLRDQETNSLPNTTIGETQQLNTIYLREFFSVLDANLEIQEQTIEDIENDAADSIEDNDVKTDLYYSLKSIADKWVSGDNQNINKGFPLNQVGGGRDRLIDKFMFVDRAMNPIGDECIINIQPLIDLSQDLDASVFTVMSQLLSHNNFEFFPLQNFMSFAKSDFRDSFKIFTNIEQEAVPAFVCMYIGGTSSFLDSEISDYQDDGIQDLVADGIPDFTGDPCETAEVRGGATISNGVRQPYSQVKAFRVRYGQQTQSFFTSIQLEGKDFPETNESIQILSNIAGDNSPSSPVPKGQNLFNVYENRAYSSTIKMLGNMSIQPTQYFQLENIPMYSGAYVILRVTHNFTANHVETEFEGTRILKFPNPIITEFPVTAGFQSGASLLGFDGASLALTGPNAINRNAYLNTISGVANIGTTTVNENIDTTSFPLEPNVDYYVEETVKSGIVIHHTAGATLNSTPKTDEDVFRIAKQGATGSIRWLQKLNRKGRSYKTGTAYVIDYAGVIYELFDPIYWSYHTTSGNRANDKKSIGIELTNEGFVNPAGGGKFKTQYGNYRRPQDAPVQTNVPFRGQSFFAPYSPQQIRATALLVNYLLDRFPTIPRTFIPNSNYYPDVKRGKWKGVINHTNIYYPSVSSPAKWDLSPAFPYEIFRTAINADVFLPSGQAIP